MNPPKMMPPPRAGTKVWGGMLLELDGSLHNLVTELRKEFASTS